MKDLKVFTSYSIKDADRAKKFYEDVLGLKVKKTPMGGCSFLELDLGETKVMLYEKPDHEPATYTVLNFQVRDISDTVRELSSKGAKFEQYEDTDKEGISHNEGPLIAWFKDPDGNFLSVIQEDEIRKDFSGSKEYAGEAPQSPS